MQKFNLSSKNVGITYPDMGDMTMEVFTGYVQAALKQNSCMEYSRMVIGREQHEGTGQMHFHCYFYYPNKVFARHQPSLTTCHRLGQEALMHGTSN